MLGGARILVADDGTQVGVNLADYFEAFGAQVVGPATSVADAMQLLEARQVDAALLGINFENGEASPLVKALTGRKVPTLLYTDYSLRGQLASEHPGVAVLGKHLPVHVLAAAVAEACTAARDDAGATPERSHGVKPATPSLSERGGCDRAA